MATTWQFLNVAGLKYVSIHGRHNDVLMTEFDGTIDHDGVAFENSGIFHGMAFDCVGK